METLRLDKWLWFARFVKSRSLAQQLIAEGTVRINDMPVAKPSATIKAGDRLTFTLRDRDRVVQVLTLAERRGPASVAVALYAESEI